MEFGQGRRPTVVLPRGTAERLDSLDLENVSRDKRRTLGVHVAAEFYLLIRDLKVRNGHLNCGSCREPVQVLVGDHLAGIEFGHLRTCDKHFEHSLLRTAQLQRAA